MLAINLSEMWPCIFGRYTNIIAAQIHLQCVSIKPSSQIKVTFSFQFQNYLFSTKLSIVEFYEINRLLILSWTQNIFFYTYFLQLSFEFQLMRMSYWQKMWTTGIDCAKFAFGIRLLQGPEIERDGDCIVTACLSQVLSDIWSLSVIINNDIVIIIITTIRIIITNINLIKLFELQE